MPRPMPRELPVISARFARNAIAASSPRARAPPDGPADASMRRRLARQAAPVYSHLHEGNSDSIGIEVAHSGRAEDPFPDAQVRSVAWLLRTLVEMSAGRVRVSDIYGHKDLD